MTMTELRALDEALPRRERRRLVTPAGVVAAAVAIAAAGFFGGVQVQKSRSDSGGGAGGFAGAQGAAGRGQGGTGQAGATPGAGGANPGAGGGAFAGATVGEVASVAGSTLYVDDSSGTTIKVKLAKGGSVTRTAKAKATAIHPGDTVIVQGETASSGTVVASSIRATASNAGAAAFGGFRSGAPQGAPGGG
jgi:hypothetical protein